MEIPISKSLSVGLKKRIKNKIMKKTGMSLSTLLFVVFLVLKLAHVIDWSWWWITFPLWFGFAVITGIALFIAGVSLLITLFGK